MSGDRCDDCGNPATEWCGEALLCQPCASRVWRSYQDACAEADRHLKRAQAYAEAVHARNTAMDKIDAAFQRLLAGDADAQAEMLRHQNDAIRWDRIASMIKAKSEAARR